MQLVQFKTYFSVVLLTGSLGLQAGLASAADPTAEELLKESDRARGAAEEGVSWEINLETFEGTNNNKVRYIVKVKGVDALAEATEPARNRGEMYLFNDRTIWFFKPGLKKPVAISARQKLMGQAANGDIASTNYFRDYSGTIVGSETVNGEPAWKMELKAKAKNVTYDGIRYWISKKNRLGVKAEFLTVSGEMFKSATFDYGNTVTSGDKSFPFISKMTIVDAVNAKNKTVISYFVPKSEKQPDSIFNVNNLLR